MVEIDELGCLCTLCYTVQPTKLQVRHRTCGLGEREIERQRQREIERDVIGNRSCRGWRKSGEERVRKRDRKKR